MSQFDIDLESLEVNYHKEHKEGRQQIMHVSNVGSVKSLMNSQQFVLFGNQKVKHVDHSPFKFDSIFSLNSDWAQGSPENILANIGGDEKRNTTSHTVSLLHKLIKQNDHHTGEEQLQDDSESWKNSNSGNISIHTTPNVG